MIANIVSMFSIMGAVHISRRIGLVRAIVISRTLQFIAMGAMAIVPTFWAMGVLYILRALLSRFANSLRQSYIMAVIKPEDAAVFHRFPSCLRKERGQ
ncbi:hypothetical protein skT53_06460 [Effusibacillus dendaii]|uniref:Uncharacterized protein n=1 Tax=Effusibacillus dendaii TaxID=2743772 RepID=A0A7I8DCM6_9BACL|nr:hypothetical protein skT53_06460 [Effusibacillus dendaii]